jgi:Flp pilus assembly protein TadD
VVEALANFYARQGQWDKAQQTFDDYARANPDSSLLPGKLKPTEGEVRPLVADAKEGLAELFFTTASILFGEESTQDTFLYLRIALDLKPNLPPAQLMLANLYEQVEDYKQAIAIYDGMEQGNVFYRRGQVRKALNLEAMGKRDQAIALLDRISRDHETDSLALITKGDMLRESQRFEEAAEAYGEALKRSQPLSGSDWPLLYARGISYERAGEWPKAEADFLQALKLEPNQPDVMNYLAYSWLMMNKNITQARQYLEVALNARPDDAHIIDSMGWAQYLSGDFESAVAAFEKAAELMPEDPTVNDHLGDAYWRVGRQTEAKFQWQRALTFKPEPEAEAAIKRKLTDGLQPFMDQQSSIVKQDHPAPEVANAPSPFQHEIR